MFALYNLALVLVLVLVRWYFRLNIGCFASICGNEMLLGLNRMFWLTKAHFSLLKMCDAGYMLMIEATKWIQNVSIPLLLAPTQSKSNSNTATDTWHISLNTRYCYYCAAYSSSSISCRSRPHFFFSLPNVNQFLSLLCTSFNFST